MALASALSEEESGIKSLPSAVGAEEDKVLLRLYITHQVLRQLGFSEQRAEQCIREGLRDGEGWSEAVEWVSSSLAMLTADVASS